MNYQKKRKIKITKLETNYTKDQKLALDLLFEFVNSDDIYIVLEGAAGTGKTTLLKDFIRYCGVGKIAVSAPTHKAVRIVSQMTNTKGETIQSILGLRPDYNIDYFNINKPVFNMEDNPKIRDYNLIVIDEASMLNSHITKFILEYARRYMCKIVFCGDPYQIPPIKERKSPVFDLENKIRIDEIVRQEVDNPLIQLLPIIRKDIDNGTNKFLKAKSKIVNGKGFMFYDSCNEKVLDNYYIQMIDYFNKNNDTRYIARTNNIVTKVNRYIRNKLIVSDDLVTKGDKLTGYRTIIDKNFNTVIINSEDYIIEECVDWVNSNGIAGFLVKIKPIDMPDNLPYIFIVNTRNHTSRYRFIKIANELVRAARLAPANKRYSRWEDFYNFKNNNILIENILDDEGNIMYSKDLDYIYSITSHKSQGCTFDYSFVNLNNIMYNPGYTFINKDYKRLAYVAISRSRNLSLILK